MTPIQKKNAAYAFSQIKIAYEKLTVPEAKKYYLTLGNGIEVHLIRKDARKSVFLGKLTINSDADMKPVVSKIWNTLRDYLMKPVEEPVASTEVTNVKLDLEDFGADSTGATSTEAVKEVEDKSLTKAVEAPKKTTSRAKRTLSQSTQKTVSQETPVVDKTTHAILSEDDSFVPDAKEEDSFSDWADKLG